MSAKVMISSKSVIIGDPREYQQELFEIAKEQNTIAVLDTGWCNTHPSIFHY